MLEGPHNGVFENIVILRKTIKVNETYHGREWIWRGKNVHIIDPGEILNDWLHAMFKIFKGEPTLYIIGDCSTTKDILKKKEMLSELASSAAIRNKAYGSLGKNITAFLRIFANRRDG